MKPILHKANTVSLARDLRGFTIIEVAVAMLVLSVGLLGVAGLQATGMQSTYQSQQRSVAMIQARDLADRMRANPSGMLAGEYIKTIPLVPPTPDCESAGSSCNAAQLAASDLYKWASMNGELLPSGQGAVACTDLVPATAGFIESGSACMITVRWDGDRTGATGLGCSGSSADLTCLQLRVIP